MVRAAGRAHPLGDRLGQSVPGNPQLGQNGFLPLPHPGLLRPLVQVVLAQQVQHGMDRKIGKLAAL